MRIRTKAGPSGRMAIRAVLALLLVLMAAVAVSAATTATVENVQTNATAEFNTGYETLKVSRSNLTANNQYIIWVLQGNETFPQAGNILYIDQAAADSAGKVSFDKVYPSSITNSTIYISGTGTNGLAKIAEVSVPYKLGDIDEDNKITTADATYVMQHVAKIVTLSGNKFSAADIDKDSKVTTADATRIMQHVAGISYIVE